MYDETPSKKHERDVLRHGNAAIEEADSFLQGQDGYEKFDDTIKAIMGEWTGTAAQPTTLSMVALNHLGKIALDMTAALTDIKPFWDYKTYNPTFEPQSTIANKMAHAWWARTHQSMNLADCIKFALAMGSSYGHIIWNPNTQDQDMIAEDARDVLPIRPGSFRSIQECAGVMIRRERTVNWIKWKYGVEVPPDRDGAYSQMRANTRVSQLLSSMGLRSGFIENLYASLGGRPKARPMNLPTADVFTWYIRDDSKNETGSSVWMGLENGQKTSWSYEVRPGEKLYPRKRCIIFTRSKIIYDDTSIYWHGLYPCPKLTLDPWPWSWLGKPPLKDLLPLQAELNRLMRIVSQHNSRVGRPGIAADKNSISRAAMDRIDTARDGLKIRHNPIAGKGIEILNEPPLDPSIQITINFLMDQMDSLSGRRELTQLMNIGQVPAMETVEKLLETMSATIRLRSQVLECFISEVAMMTLSNMFQFYTLPQRVAMLGPTGTTFEDFDFDPNSLIPDMIEELGAQENGDPLPRDQRAREFLRYFSYQIAPGSLLASSGITDKMMYLQLFRMGVIDAITLLEKLQIPNIGAPQDIGPSIMERLKWQAQQGIGQQAGPASGRKASGQSSPRLVMKESS